MKELVFARTLLPAWQRGADEIGFINAATGEQRTFGEHADRVSRLCDAVSTKLGICLKDRVTVLGINSIEYLELWHAGFLGAFVVNPLNLRFSAEELIYVLQDAETSVCFVDSTFAPMIEKIRDAAGLKHVVLMGGGEGAADLTYEDLLAGADNVWPEVPEEDDLCVVMYTGGTTGKPKGVMLDQRAEVLNQYHIAMTVPWQPNDAYIVSTPMFHGASMLGVVGAAMFGVPVVIQPMFEPAGFMAAVEKYNCTVTVLVPTMIGMVVNHPEFAPERISSIKRLIYGASPMPKSLLEKLLAMLPDTGIYQGYGMTEAATVLTFFTDADHREGSRLGSCGRALAGIDLKIVDEDGNDLPTGQAGEVYARGGNFMQGYLKLPAETEKAFRGGWYASGDVGYLDDKGYLFLVDRAKDMIISGGENIYSVEVENAIGSHPEVIQVAVIGIPSEQWGEAVHAICVVKEGSALTADDVIAHARTSIGGYKVPRSVDFRIDPFPLSGAMKVLKKDLRAPYWAGKDRAIN
ncbi:AMP-binding protein [Sporichthya sp.]|uniref:AMP-binding protein n=1 Tax=Sporichthya sp. TaxID=65475 RepID=UPI0018150836|nr:AMP-binding protein [Sporichthya sp.]MBA3744299.1 AMP-binding protein [Sporichthya sp.]